MLTNVLFAVEIKQEFLMNVLFAIEIKQELLMNVLFAVKIKEELLIQCPVWVPHLRSVGWVGPLLGDPLLMRNLKYGELSECAQF